MCSQRIMNKYTFVILLWLCVFCNNAVRIRVKYDSFAPDFVPNNAYQEILSTIYVDAKAQKELIEPQYITSLEEITYRQELNETEFSSFYNFRKLTFVSMVDNGQEKVPNFRNLPKLNKIQIKQCKLSSIDKNSLSNVPVKMLDFQKNRIDKIEAGAFGKKVQSLDLKCNILPTISSDWFRNASSLVWLNLESNKIQELVPNLFAKFVNLEELHLARNEIVTLGQGSLSGPKLFQVLDFGSNDISMISSNVFSPRRQRIINLRLSFNRISFFSEELMGKITVLNSTVLYGNPIQCPCVERIRDWLADSHVQAAIADEATCVFTSDYSKECLHQVELNHELYNAYITSFQAVDHKACDISAEEMKDLKIVNTTATWFWGDIDLRHY